jgi:cell division protein FtsA
VEKTQNQTHHKVSSAFVNISGAHIRADNARGKINLPDKEDEISPRNLDAAYRNARSSVVTYDRESVLVVPQNYMVDGQAAIKNPAGLFGSRLEADYLFITGSVSSIENLSKAVNLGGLEIEELVLSNLASSFSVLSQSEKDLGVILVDLGASVSEVTVFTDGIIRYDKMLSCGAEVLVNAISSQLKVQPQVAAKILKDYCNVSSSIFDTRQQDILIKELEPPKTINTAHLQKIIEPKITQILGLIKEAIDKSNYSSAVACGVVLIGGISTMDGLAEMAETVFNMPTRVGSHKGLNVNANVTDLSCITAVGLAEYGCMKMRQAGMGRQLGENMFRRAFEAARDFIYDYF